MLLLLMHSWDGAYISRPSRVEAQSCLRFGGDLTSPTGLVWSAQARWKPWPGDRSDDMRGMRSRADATEMRRGPRNPLRDRGAL
ncbi:hypothetical protein Y032_0465g1943 [Ancylostoma ceylanicum]|uniref:Uncharacterized protein n=1 Tax=Ancylostoma ceylanicum TaxID=53326 RepID=A0A016WXI8_9BILA|nr:hypothetical protein Y032_0465g1943 [Ancylostoma ceylanicum]